MCKYKGHILAILVGVCLGVGLFVITVAQAWPLKNSSRQQGAITPEVVSCVKTIRVVKRTINDAGTPHASVVVKVENMSDLGIIAVSLESKHGKDTYTVLASTFEADEPTALIKPHETFSLTMALSSTVPNVPLQIGSVIYLDGTEDGCESSLKTMRNSKTHHERVKAEKKGSLQ